MRNLGLFAVIFLVGLASCSKNEPLIQSQESASVAKVPVDTSTPDKTLKSYWAVSDLVRRKKHEIYRQFIEKFADASAEISAVTMNALANESSVNQSPLETFSRDILEVKVESESRAVIIAVIKNSTPIPPGAELTNWNEKHRINGDRYRYIFEKDQSGWRVAEVWGWSNYPNPDWKKMRPSDGKLYVSTLTYEGM